MLKLHKVRWFSRHHSNLDTLYLAPFRRYCKFLCSWLHSYSTIILGCFRCTRSPMLGTMWAGTLCYSAVKLFSKYSPGTVEADVGWGGKLNSHLMASCFRNICAKNRQNPLILLNVTIDNIGVPFWDRAFFEKCTYGVQWGLGQSPQKLGVLESFCVKSNLVL